ncbi:23797_t:CDS:2, partial [Cetraspora pellucida]
YPVGTKRPSVNHAARNFGLSEATLRCAIKKGGPPNHQGPPTILTEHEENQLVGYCMNMQQLGFGLTKSEGVYTIPGLLQGAPPGVVMGFTDTGYMREDLFQMYLSYFTNSIPPIRLVLLMLDGHKSHISYMCIDFCRQNGILLYALPPHMTHILQPSEIPFAKLKKEFGKQCNKYHNTTSKVVTKYIFAKLFGPAFIETYAPSAICNAFKATGIWPFNPKAISPDHLNLSLATERFDIVPSPSQLLKPVTSFLQSTTKLNHSHYTHINFTQLMSENKMLKNEIELLKVQLTVTQEELGTYKSPRTSSLCSVFKYIPHVLQAGPSDTSLVNQQEPGLFSKKRKTLPFAQLLTNDESWRKLKETNKEAERKVEEAKWKKVLAAQKKSNDSKN